MDTQKPGGTEHEHPEAAPDMPTRAASQSSNTQRSIGELIASISEQASTLVRGEIDYASANLKAKIQKLGVGGVLLAVAAFLAVFIFLLLLLAAVSAFANIMPVWAAFLTVAGILIILAAILAAIGTARLKASKRHVVNPKDGLSQDIEAFKKGIKK